MSNASWSVSRRLNVALGLVALMTLAIVALMYSQVAAQDEATRDLVEVRMVRLSEVTMFQRLASTMTVKLLALNRSNDPQIARQFGPEIAPQLDKMKELRERIYTWATTEEEKALLANNNAESVQARAAIKAMDEARSKGDGAAVLALLETTFLPHSRAADAGIEAFAKFEYKKLNDAVYASQAANRSRALASAVGLGLLTLLTAWACLIGHSLRRVLGAEPVEVKAAADAVRRGDLTTAIKTRPSDADSIIAAMKAMRDSLVAVVSGVHDSADGVAQASAGIASSSQSLSERTTHQASALEQTAASIEQLGAKVRQNADNAFQASKLATSASDVAVRGGVVVSQVVETMKDINGSSKRIADIIGVIDGIAFQTNILALNAAVEAARAGEQGRGFAVVASEVRSLAQRSADAAKEIKTLIGSSVQRVEQGTVLVDEAGRTMNDVVASIQRVAAIIGDISVASGEQTTGVGQVTQAVSEMDRSTQQNAVSVKAGASAADGLNEQAKRLVQAVAVFKLSPGLAA